MAYAKTLVRLERLRPVDRIAMLSIGAIILLGLLFIAGEVSSEAQSLDSAGNSLAGKATEPSLPRPINPTIELDVTQPAISGSFLAKSDAVGNTRFPAQPIGAGPDPEGPDLDLGYCNYLDIRFKASAGFNGDVNLMYNCTGPGMSGSPESHGTVTIPNSLIPRDGAEHSYRLDMGLQPYWRGRLTGLNLAVSAGTVDFAGATVGVGDVPGDIYVANREFPKAKDPLFAATHELESKHFRIIWSLEREQAGFTEKVAHGTLRNAEEIWQFYVKVLHMIEPCHSINPEFVRPEKFKINLLNVYEGFWMGGSPTGFGFLNITTAGLAVDPPGWVMPHELMHVFEMHQGGQMSGQWWEAYANYGRERWLYYYSPFLFPNKAIPGGAVSNLEAAFPEQANWILPHSRDYYLCWPIFLYLDENPDNLPGIGGGDFTPKLWQQAKSKETIFDTLLRITNGQLSIKDIIGLYARRNVTWDYSHHAALQNNAPITDANNPSNLGHLRRYCLSELDQCGEDPSWWRVPLDRAPQQGGYTIHELTLDPSNKSRTVSVNFRGLPDQARGADWRVSLVILNDSGKTRYSSMWSSGMKSVTLAPDENNLYLVVAATPDPYLYGEFDDEAFPYRSSPQRQRFPYEVQLQGALPYESDNGKTDGLVQHLNGGGWKSPTATVDATAYIGPNARVLGSAKVLGSARVEDFGVVKDVASVLDHAVVSGHASVRDQAIVKDFAKVRDWAVVTGTAVANDHARILQHADVGGSALVTGSATVEGYSVVRKDALANFVGGDAVLMGDYYAGLTVLNGFQSGFIPYQGTLPKWIDDRKAPPHLFVDYELGQANQSFAKDGYGVSDGILRGSPEWSAGDEARKGFLIFNGVNQFVSLPREVSDFRQATFAAWVKPGGGPANQPVFFFGTDADHFFYATVDDGGDLPELVVHYPHADLKLRSSIPPSLGDAWTHIAASFDGTTATLFVDGKIAAAAPCNLTPDQFLAPNIETGRQQSYLGRGIGNQFSFFKGGLAGFRVYSKALSQDEVAGVSREVTSQPSN